jgi:Uma2 family endonuclease
MAVGTQRYTVEEFERFIEEPGNAERLFEFVGGEIVEVPSNPYGSHIAMRIARRLAAWVEDRQLGFVTGEAGGYIISGERYAPDVAYISKARQPRLAERGYNPNPPELAVEVLSPSDQPGGMRVKLTNYLAAGTTVWVVDPERRVVEVHAPGQRAQIARIDGTLDGGEILPGFQLAVKDIFPD